MTSKEYNRLVDNESDSLFRFALRVLADATAAEDVVQEAFTRLWERIDTVESGKGKSYLFTTGYHLAIDLIRSRTERVDMEAHGALYEPLPPDIRKRLDEGLALLPEVQRSVILLRDYEGYSYEEIGSMASLSEMQVKVYIHRGRAFLRRFLGELCDLI